MQLIESYYDIFDRSAHLDSLLHDCKVAFDSKHLNNSNENYSLGSTYFIKANEKPRCLLESIALDIFSFHTKDISQYNVKQSGAEWWTQVIDSRDDIGFHWDRDYDLEEVEGIHKHPLKATVTYLTNSGGPTIVLDKVGTTDSSISLIGKINNFSISKPMIGKSISFDGNLLHAAPSGINELDDNEDSDEDTDNNNTNEYSDENAILRVTLLVNIWIDHIPSQAKKYPKKLLSKMTSITISNMNIPLDWSHKQNCNSNNDSNNNDSNNDNINLSKTNCIHNKKWMFNNSNLNYDIIFPMLSCDAMSALLASNDIINLSYSTTTTSGSDSEIAIEIIQSSHQSDSDLDGNSSNNSGNDNSSNNSDDGDSDTEEEVEEEDESDEINNNTILINKTNKKQRQL